MEDLDLFGNKIEKDVILREEFLENPFSILDAKGGKWQARKKKWLEKGIRSDIGRDAKNICYERLGRKRGQRWEIKRK